MREEKAIQKVKNRDPDGLQALMDRYIPYVSQHDEKAQLSLTIFVKQSGGSDEPPQLFYLPGLKLSFRPTERLKTRCSGVLSLLSGQK